MNLELLLGGQLESLQNKSLNGIDSRFFFIFYLFLPNYLRLVQHIPVAAAAWLTEGWVKKGG